ncbi:hypothetical protein AAE478_007614 [Parahypoxylon ruwenzoriense]
MEPRNAIQSTTTTTTIARQPLIIRSISAAETYPLRHAVLWPNKPVSHVRLSDDHVGYHFGAFVSSPILSNGGVDNDNEDINININKHDGDRLAGKEDEDEDEEPHQRHQQRPASTISLFVNEQSGEARFRKFATAPEWQGRGVGSALLAHAIESAARAGATNIWCDARQSALPFYQRFGMSGQGEVFFKDDVPYLRMSKRLP